MNVRLERDIRRTADMVFPGPRVAVFIDGCFWHGCEAHYTRPTSNATYWSQKVERNRQRDLETNMLLSQRGWTILRFWEHEDAVAVADAIEAILRGTAA